MVKEIRIITDNDFDNKKIVLPLKGKKYYLNIFEAENILQILRGQINIIKAKDVNKKRKGRDTEDITRKTCGTNRGPE